MSLPGEVEHNLKQIVTFARRAARESVDLLLTPELSATGYGSYPEVLALAEVAGKGPIYEALARAAEATEVVIAAGFVEAAGDKKHLSHYVVYPDRRFVTQRKHRVTLSELPLDSGVPLDPPDYEHAPPIDPADPGQPHNLDFRFFEVKGVRCAIAICADGGITRLYPYLASQDVELCLHPAGAGGNREDRVTSEELATEAGRDKYLWMLEQVFCPGAGIKQCIQYGIAAAAVNVCGYDGRRYYHLGHGTIITPMGEVPAVFHGLPNLDRQRPCYASAVVDVLDRLEIERPKIAVS